jgi:7-carboxy-7-deazaguanine synthase
MTVTDNKYFVSEIFESIQGEGNFAGVFCLFIRFQFCNLSCTWCDTKYTWYINSGKFKEYTSEELKEIIFKSRAQHIIFTGGEPALYRLDDLVVAGKHNHVETNATVIPTAPLSIELRDKTIFNRNSMDNRIVSTFNWVVSPKLSNSNQKINKETIKFWVKQKFCIFKFIVKSHEDLDEAEQLITKFGISSQKVYIGLEGNTLQSQLRTDMVEEIVRRRYNFSPRLQILFWGNERGK